MLCMPKIKFISTSISSNSNLKTHIKHVYPSELIKLNEFGKRKPYNNNNCTQPKKQLKLSEVGKTVKNLSQTEFDKANLELIINTVSSFSLIEHPAFIKYCHLTSNKVPLSRKSLMRNDMIQQLKTELEKIEYVCITADCWNIFHRSYMGFTIHWLNPITLERNSRDLAYRCMLGRHTYDNIAELIDNVLTEFDIKSKTTLIVTDNAANFVKAFKVFGTNNEIDNSDYKCYNNIEMCEIEIENVKILRTINITEILDGQTQNTQNINNVLDIKLPKHQRCVAHTLNLIATVDILEAEKDGSYKVLSRRVFAKCQSIFSKHNQLTQCADKIKEILGRYLTTLNATRKSNFSSTGWMILIVPTIAAINKAFNEFNNLNFCRPLVHALKNGLTKRFKNYMQSKILQVSLALLPKFNKFGLIPKTEIS